MYEARRIGMLCPRNGQEYLAHRKCSQTSMVYQTAEMRGIDT